MSVSPDGCTKILQPFDVFINKQFKEYFLGKYDDWFHQGMFEYTAGGKGKFQSKKCCAQMKESENASKPAITDLNVPNVSRDILFQSHDQDFGQDGHCHFVGFSLIFT